MSEDHLRQIENRGRTATAFFGLVHETSQAERERMNEIIINQHGGEIDSLKEKIEEKNEEILRLHKAIKVLEDKNKKLDIALKTRNEEVAKLKTRLMTSDFRLVRPTTSVRMEILIRCRT